MRDVVFAEIGGNLVAFSRITYARQEDGIGLYDVAGEVLPQWRRRGLGAALLRQAVSRQRELAWRHPEDDPKLLQSCVFEGQIGARDENEYFGRRRGYTEYINVARDWRRRGVARALIARSLSVLKERGMLEAGLDVYVHNPTGARELYESLGYRKVRSLSCYRREL